MNTGIPKTAGLVRCTSGISAVSDITHMCINQSIDQTNRQLVNTPWPQ